MQLSAEQLAATAIADNLVVNAGAGSGKTTVLTHRYVRLLEEGGLSPKEIVAITFTKKAAREMRERIGLRLREKAAGGSSYWKQVQDELVHAPIGTIHSFYARILRAFPVQAGIDPGFRVLEEMEAGMILNDALASMIQKAIQEGDKSLRVLATILGAQALEEESLVLPLRDIYRTLLNRGIPVEEALLTAKYNFEWQLNRERFAAIIAGEVELAESLIGKDKPGMIQARLALVQAGEKLSSLRNPEGLLALYEELLPLTQLKGGRIKGHKEFINGATAELSQLLTGGLAPVLGEATLSLLVRLDQEFKLRKAKVRGLDFSDLQLAVWRLLQGNPQVIGQLRKGYRTYMIDEFQDTDRLQHKIITILVEEEIEIPQGRLFVVGDEKQSIYRFRGAEVRVFDAVRRRLTAANPLAEKRITCNYRSQQPLIGLVNSFFSQLMDKSQGSEIEYINLTAHRDGIGPCAELLDCVPIAEETTAEAEARTLAERLFAMVEEEKKVRYGDIAVLIRSRTHLKEYEHNLRLAGIPYTVVGGIGFYQQQEVQDLVNLLRVVDNRRDELSLAAVLRSPYIGLDDDSLLALALARQEQGGSLLDYGTVLEPEPFCRLRRAAEIISGLRLTRGRLEIPRLVERAMDLILARELNLTRFAGLQRYANLEKFLALAEQYSSAGNHNLTGFLQWLEYAATQSEGEAQVDSEESDSVKIMTIHASKGLEFPVVFIPACSTALKTNFGKMLLDNEGRLAFKYPWQCALWDEICAHERQRELEEHKRLLYVAVTRARDRLVILVREAGRNTNSFNNWLQEFAAVSPAHFLLAEPGQGSDLNIQLPSALPETKLTQSVPIVNIFPGLRPLGKGRRTFLYFSITQFMLWRLDREQFNQRYLSRSLDADFIDFQTLGQDLGHEPGGSSFGSLLHSAIDAIQPETDISSLLGSLVPNYFPESDATQRDRIYYSAKTLLGTYQKQPLPPGEFSQSISEQEFYCRLGNALFHGLMDRVLIAPDHVVILDYKSNRIPEEGIQPLLDIYASQLRFYALAAEKIYKKPVRAYLQLLRMPVGEQLAEISLEQKELQELQASLENFVQYCQG